MDAGIDDFEVREVLLGRIDRRRHRQCIEEPEQRPELMFNDKPVQKAPTSRGQNDDLAGQRLVMNEIENMFERASVGRAINGRANDNDIGALDRLNNRGRTLVFKQSATTQGREQMRRRVHKLDQLGFGGRFFLDGVEKGFYDRSGPRGPLRTSGYADDRSHAHLQNTPSMTATLTLAITISLTHTKGTRKCIASKSAVFCSFASGQNKTLCFVRKRRFDF